MQYCENIYKTKRFITREVKVGSVGIGGDNPIRIQSMTTSDTRDSKATIDQIIRLADYGCEIARVTVQGMKEVDSCEKIKNGLIQKGYTIPLVADIHFYPPAALRVADVVDKVRINPGNFADRRATFRILEYDDDSYAQEIDRIEERFVPLIEKCKKLKRSIRIGTNHGSLSDRVMNRYGDSPKGMVESALEYTRICRKYDFHNIIFSMKASNTHVMIEAYRLLVAEMMTLGWDYPLHLGVTEAGEGEDGRIKSAVGIGALLVDGLGDTIRVSLTEDPWYEMDPCKRLLQYQKELEVFGSVPAFNETFRNPFNKIKRVLPLLDHPFLHRDGSVGVKANGTSLQKDTFYQEIGCDVQLQRPQKTVSNTDILILEDDWTSKDDTKLNRLKELGIGIFSKISTIGHLPLVTLDEIKEEQEQVVSISDEDRNKWKFLKTAKVSFILLAPKKDKIHFSRAFFEWLYQNDLQIPVILNFAYLCSKEDFLIQSSVDCGSLLCDGLGEGVLLEGDCDISFLRKTGFNILQASRMRASKTEFISCPGCGRTLFNLQEVAKKIHERTAHLPGVKIAIMGCIVNGPGEMADADFGYVGSKPDMIDLYVGKKKVEANIPYTEAVDCLIGLLKKHDRWTEPKINIVESVGI